MSPLQTGVSGPGPSYSLPSLLPGACKSAAAYPFPPPVFAAGSGMYLWKSPGSWVCSN